MNYQVYIYGRTYEKDFRTLCIPNDSVVHHDNLIQIKNFAKEVLNTDRVSNGRITPDRSRYSFAYLDEFILWGIGFSHDSDSFGAYGLKEYRHDKKHRTGLRSFVGIVMDRRTWSEINYLPYTNEFFYGLYKKYVTPSWFFPEFKQWSPIISDNEVYSIESEQCLLLSGDKHLNNDKDFCNYYTITEQRAILASLKSCTSNLITGLNVESHVESATRARIPMFINNAICNETLAFHREQIKHETSTFPQPKTGEKTKTIKKRSARCFRWIIERSRALKKFSFVTILLGDDKTSKCKRSVQECVPNDNAEITSSASTTSDIVSFVQQMRTQDKADATHQVGEPQITDQLLDWGLSWNALHEDYVGNSEENVALESTLIKEKDQNLTEYNLFSTSNEDSTTKEIQNKIQIVIQTIGVDETLKLLDSIIQSN